MNENHDPRTGEFSSGGGSRKAGDNRADSTAQVAHSRMDALSEEAHKAQEAHKSGQKVSLKEKRAANERHLERMRFENKLRSVEGKAQLTHDNHPMPYPEVRGKN